MAAIAVNQRELVDQLYKKVSTEQFSAAHRFVAEEITQHIERIDGLTAGTATA